LEDFNGDGLLDFFVANGHVEDRTWMGRGEPFAMPAQVFLGEKQGLFQEVSEGGGDYFGALRLGRGVAAGDFDSDGSVDLAVSCQGTLADILRNESPRSDGGRMISLQLVGMEANRQAIGAWVEVLGSQGNWLAGRGVFGGGSYASASDLRVHMLAPEGPVVVRVTWPAGSAREYTLDKGESEVILHQRGNLNP
jgi:hypothetical protein